MIKVILEQITDEAPGIKTFYFRPNRTLHYVAGQFTELTLEHDADDRGQKRWFTLSSSPTDDLLSITTKFASKGSSFKQELLRLQTGQELELAEPMGDFVLPKHMDLPLVFIAGGIGITPFHSMVKYLIDTNQERPITLLYAAVHEEELVFTDLFKKYCKATHFIVSEPSKTWSGESGRLTMSHIQDVADIYNSMIYFSGPEPMVESFYKQLTELGVKQHRLVTDYFPGYKAF